MLTRCIVDSEQMNTEICAIKERERRIGDASIAEYLDKLDREISEFQTADGRRKSLLEAHDCAIANVASVHPLNDRHKKELVLKLFDCPSEQALQVRHLPMRKESQCQHKHDLSATRTNLTLCCLQQCVQKQGVQ